MGFSLVFGVLGCIPSEGTDARGKDELFPTNTDEMPSVRFELPADVPQPHSIVFNDGSQTFNIGETYKVPQDSCFNIINTEDGLNDYRFCDRDLVPRQTTVVELAVLEVTPDFKQAYQNFEWDSGAAGSNLGLDTVNSRVAQLGEAGAGGNVTVFSNEIHHVVVPAGSHTLKPYGNNQLIQTANGEELLEDMVSVTVEAAAGQVVVIPTPADPRVKVQRTWADASLDVSQNGSLKLAEVDAAEDEVQAIAARDVSWYYPISGNQYLLQSTGLSTDVSTFAGETVSFEMQRIDVHHIDVTENGEPVEYEGTYSVFAKRAEPDAWVDLDLGGATGTGVWVHPGYLYRVEIGYRAFDGTYETLVGDLDFTNR